MLPFYKVLAIHTFIQVQYHTQNASLPNPTESQWGSLKFPGQPDKYDYFQIQEYQRVKYCTHNSEAFTMELLALIPWGKMTNMCVSELGVHWLKQWLVACLAQVHYLYRHFVWSISVKQISFWCEYFLHRKCTWEGKAYKRILLRP